MTFDELNLSKPLLKALDELGYIYPTPIQHEAFPVIMSGRDLIGIAQTGTGKTFAYLLPLLRQLNYSEQLQPRVLIVVPTRELVIQVCGEVEKLSKHMRLRYAGVYGGTNIQTQKTLVAAGLDILVATPGRLMDLFLSGVLRFRSIQKLVIDEVDEMLHLGFRTQLINMMDSLPAKRQNLLLSATLSEDVEKLIASYFNTPAKIEIEARGTPLQKISQSAYRVPNFYTKAHLLEILLKDEAMSKVLVFVKSKRLADRLIEEMEHPFPGQLGVIHSNRSQPQRFGALNQFEDGTHRVLIATDIIARGLDIHGVTHVINFDMPDEAGDYIHRIGRTGRADKHGTAISFINEAERGFQEAIETLMGQEIPINELPEVLNISTIFTDEELPYKAGKNYLRPTSIKESGGAFHKKSAKNSKLNLGGPNKRNPKEGKTARVRREKMKTKRGRMEGNSQ